MPEPIPASKVNSDNQNIQILVIFVWPGNHIFRHFCAPGGVEVFGWPHMPVRAAIDEVKATLSAQRSFPPAAGSAKRCEFVQAFPLLPNPMGPGTSKKS